MATRVYGVTMHLSGSLESFPAGSNIHTTVQIFKDDRIPSPLASSGSGCLEKNYSITRIFAQSYWNLCPQSRQTT
jgi:hypothetical protein